MSTQPSHPDTPPKHHADERLALAERVDCDFEAIRTRVQVILPVVTKVELLALLRLLTPIEGHTVVVRAKSGSQEVVCWQAGMVQCRGGAGGETGG